MFGNDIGQPFDSIESAHDFLDILAATILDATKDVNNDYHIAMSGGEERQAKATALALFKLKVLSCHIHKARRTLNDLRMIRRLLLSERTTVERELATL